MHEDLFVAKLFSKFCSKSEEISTKRQPIEFIQNLKLKLIGSNWKIQ